MDLKGRFEVDRNRVRARYGHSLELEEKPHHGMPPATLYHGTTHRFLPKILEGGLQPIKRQFVHLSPDKKTARQVGRRRDQEPAILVVDAHAAHESGVQFYPRGKGIWLSDPIPPTFLRVLDQSDEEHVGARSTAVHTATTRSAATGAPRRRRQK